MCESANFVDIINQGYSTNPTWVGTQRLGKQIYIFSDEATIVQENFMQLFNTHNTTINTL